MVGNLQSAWAIGKNPWWDLPYKSLLTLESSLLVIMLLLLSMEKVFARYERAYSAQ
jgi:hypothetical protein